MDKDAVKMPSPVQAQLPVLITGAGRLLETIQALGDGLERSIRRLPTQPGEDRSVEISIYDTVNRTRDVLLQERAVGSDNVWLPVRAEFGYVWVGPLVAGLSGCLECLELRKDAMHPRPLARSRLSTVVDASVDPNPFLSSRVLASLVFQLGLAIAHRQLEEAARANIGREVVRVSVLDLTHERLRLMAVPDCASCLGRRLRQPDRRLMPAGLEWTDASQVGPNGRRALSPEQIAVALGPSVLDASIGLVQNAWYVQTDAAGSLPVAAASISVSNPRTAQAPEFSVGWGASDKPEAARGIALLEALERYTCLPRGQVMDRRCSANHTEPILEPAKLILYSDRQYAAGGFPYRPYDAETELDWVWAYSLRQGCRIAVPSDFVYWGRNGEAGNASSLGRRLVQGTSSGSAIGASPAEAALYGTLEVLERDAFLISWYAQKPLPRLTLSGTRAGLAVALQSRLDLRGFDLHLFDITQPGVPVAAVWAMAVNRESQGVKVMSGSGCDASPRRAVESAIREVVMCLDAMERVYPVRRGRGAELVAGTRRVDLMEDHALLYAMPEAFGRLSFLFQTDFPATPVEEHFFTTGHLAHEKPVTFGGLVHALLNNGFDDVVLVDQTTTDLRTLNLTVMRVLVPGTLPMTFGVGRERVAGASRLLQSLDLSREELPAHPFP